MKDETRRRLLKITNFLLVEVQIKLYLQGLHAHLCWLVGGGDEDHNNRAANALNKKKSGKNEV